MDRKSNLKWYKKVKEENGPVRYIGSWEGQVAVQLRFQLKKGSEDKKRWGMVEEDRCVLCNGGKAEDMFKHLECGEFEQDRCYETYFALAPTE